LLQRRVKGKLVITFNLLNYAHCIAYLILERIIEVYLIGDRLILNVHISGNIAMI